MAGLERGAPPGDERRPRPERELAAARRSRAAGRRTGRGRRRPAPLGVVEPLPRPVRRRRARRSGRRRRRLARRSRIRWRVDLAIPSKTSSRRRRPRAAARSGGATAGSPRSGGSRRPRSPRGTRSSAAGTSGSAATTSIPSAGEQLGDRDLARRQAVEPSASAATGTGPRGRYALPPPTSGHAPGQRQHPAAVVVDQEPRPPARPRAGASAHARDW